MISKELMSEITGIPDNAIKSISIGKIIVSVRKINGIVEEYNIYELAHKCKEEAYSLGFDIYSDLNGADVCLIGSNYSLAPFHHNVTEIEAIFKAYQWVLDNRGKK